MSYVGYAACRCTVVDGNGAISKITVVIAQSPASGPDAGKDILDLCARDVIAAMTQPAEILDARYIAPIQTDVSASGTTPHWPSNPLRIYQCVAYEAIGAVLTGNTWQRFSGSWDLDPTTNIAVVAVLLYAGPPPTNYTVATVTKVCTIDSVLN